MSQTSHGLLCDVCDHYILPVVDQDAAVFTVQFVDGELHCHQACKTTVQKCAGNYAALPEGALRRAFVEALASQQPQPSVAQLVQDYKTGTVTQSQLAQRLTDFPRHELAAYLFALVTRT